MVCMMRDNKDRKGKLNTCDENPSGNYGFILNPPGNKRGMEDFRTPLSELAYGRLILQ